MAPENAMTFDFTGAPPVTGMPGGDRIAPGTYLLAVKALDKAPSKAGKPMVTATLAVANEGPAVGKKLIERFVFPRSGTDDSDFGLRRWHGFLVALGMKERKGKLTLDLNTLLTKELVSEVDDETVPASGEYAERTVSRPLAFYRKGSPEGEKVGQTRAVASVAAPAVAPAPAAQPAAAPAAADDFASEEPAEAAAPADEEGDLFADLE